MANRPIPVDPAVIAMMPLWVIAALRFLSKRHPSDTQSHVHRNDLKRQLLSFEIIRSRLPKPNGWMEIVVHKILTSHLDREIQAISDLLDHNFVFGAVLPAGDNLQEIIAEAKQGERKKDNKDA